jgi:hypothetical protein
MGTIGTTILFKLMVVQKKDPVLLKGGTKHILLFDEFWSKKTTVPVMVVIYQALRFAGSRHLIYRYPAEDTRPSVLWETLSPSLGKGANTL